MKLEEKDVKLMFNPELKNKFITDLKNRRDSIAETTEKGYIRIFIITQKFEEQLDRDLMYFNIEEIETILHGFEANNRNTIETYGRIISGYLNWGVQEGLIKHNVLADFRPDDFNKYLTNNEKYFTEEELTRYEDFCKNYQDSVLLRLLFIGVGGRQLSEIRNLKKEYIDLKNKRMIVYNSLKEDELGNPIKATYRYIDFDDRTAELIKGALDDTIYHKLNGDDLAENIKPYLDLVESDYLIRPSAVRTDIDNADKPIDKFVIYRRIKNVAQNMGLEKLTAKFIQRSGMIHLANEVLSDDDEKIQLEDYKLIADTFNIKSYHNLKGFLTVENVRETYPNE